MGRVSRRLGILNDPGDDGRIGEARYKRTGVAVIGRYR
jgi:hypothetical protein